MNAARGRPRSFDDDDTLARVLDLFWKQGFGGTSLADLCAVTGLNKPSLYGAFGNKEALFLAAMERYHRLYVAPPVAAMLAEPDAREAFRDFLLASVEKVTNSELPGGCFIATNSATIDSGELPDVAATALEQEWQFTRAAMTQRLERAVADGQVPPDTDVGSLVSFMEMALAGLAALAKSGVSRAALVNAMEMAMRAWPEPPRG